MQVYDPPIFSLHLLLRLDTDLLSKKNLINVCDHNIHSLGSILSSFWLKVLATLATYAIFTALYVRPPRRKMRQKLPTIVTFELS